MLLSGMYKIFYLLRKSTLQISRKITRLDGGAEYSSLGIQIVVNSLITRASCVVDRNSCWTIRIPA